jgi:tripartite-type tricarboxylate transporter receptor subunit TctC
VVFRGTAPAITELMAGRIDILCDQATNTVPYIRDGRVMAYAVTSPQRLPGLPQLPTTAEAGFPGIAMSAWHGLFAPAGTPEPVVARLSAALHHATGDAATRERLALTGNDAVTDTPAEFAARTAREREVVKRIVRESGIRAE